MMRVFFITILFVLCKSVYSQKFNGEFKSYSISYKDDLNSNENYRGEKEFDIAIYINKRNDDGRIVIFDKRFSDRIEVFVIESYVGVLKDGFYLYNCRTDHLKDTKSVKAIFYYDTDKNLNLMINYDNYSFVYFDLVKQ